MRSTPSSAGRTLASSLALAAGGLGFVASADAQQWTVINLHPVGLANSEARAIDGNQIVGVTGSSQGALLWQGSSLSMLRLDAQNGSSGSATGVFAGRQGGTVGVGTGVATRSHAVLWSGSYSSMVDLHPGAAVAVHTNLAAIDGATQVGNFLAPDGSGGGAGFSAGRPCMWSGTAGSFVDLTPAGYTTGEARGVYNGQQVGATFDNFFGSACMWTGSAESFVSLNPDAALFSVAQCTDGANQFGAIGILDPIPGIFPCRWSGTADSYEVLFTPDPESHWGEIHACDVGGNYAVGYITDNDGISNARACVWSGGDADFADIHQHLPAGMSDSNALGVWRHQASGTTYVVGYATRTATAQREAVMWVHGSGTNLIASAKAPANLSAAPGQPMVYTVRVQNVGPAASSGTTLTVALPASAVASYVGASPAPSSVSSTQLVFNLGSIAGSGGFADFTVTLNAAASGATASITATAASSAESDPTNNAATVSSTIQGVLCAADLGVQGGGPGQDGALDNNDFIAFINYFFDSDAHADLGVQGGGPGHDGVFDNNDFIAFINFFFDGC